MVEMPGMYQTGPQSEKKRLANGTDEKLLNELSKKPLLYHSMHACMQYMLVLLLSTSYTNPLHTDSMSHDLIFRP